MNRPPENSRAAEGTIDDDTEVSLAFRLGWAGFVLLATSAPYLINWLQTPNGYHYTWWLPINSQDQYAYMAWAQQAAHGALLFKIKYTALPQTPFLFQPFFLLCGGIKTLLHLDLGFTFFALKAVGVVLFFASLYRYLDFLRVGRVAFFAASILIGISAGLNEIFALLGVDWNLPADYVPPEISTYRSLVFIPLFPF